MRSYSVALGVKKANGKDLDSYSGSIVLNSAPSVPVRSIDVTFIWNSETNQYESSFVFDDLQFSDFSVFI